LTIPLAAHAYDGEAHGKPKAAAVKEQEPRGIAGNVTAVRCTIGIIMTDAMRFSSGAMTAKKDKTVRFVIKNQGSQLHEMVTGTEQELDKHAAAMPKFPNME
jgi:uncharacterized cupredoxin-like copper-binding protein